MKKLFTLLFVLLFFASSNIAYGGNSEVFYDKYLEGLYSSLSLPMINSGIAPDKVDKYITAMKGRVDKKSLINSTWACVREKELLTKFEESGEVDGVCFDQWRYDFMNKNTDLLELLK